MIYFSSLALANWDIFFVNSEKYILIIFPNSPFSIFLCFAFPGYAIAQRIACKLIILFPSFLKKDIKTFKHPQKNTGNNIMNLYNWSPRFNNYQCITILFSAVLLSTISPQLYWGIIYKVENLPSVNDLSDFQKIYSCANIHIIQF